MRYQIEFSFAARYDMWRIAEYLRDNNFREEIIDEIEAKIYNVLGNRPLSGAFFNEELGVRKVLILRKNIIYYEVHGNIVSILHVRAGGMNVEF